MTLCAALSLAGCGTVSPRSSQLTATTIQGHVYGGQQPVAGATIQLYTVGVTGDGSAATPLLTSTVTTDANGNFGLTGLYSCSAATYVYMTATGGQPLTGVTNPNLALMTALGACSSLGPSTFITINEVTTVAAVAALAPFMSSATAVGSGPSDVASLQAAFTTAQQYASSATGFSPGTGIPAGMSVPSTTIYTLADILGACVNSTGGTAGDGSSCGNLFTATTFGYSIPADTVVAALNIVLDPAANLATLFALVPSSAPFQPTLTSAPSTFLAQLSATSAPGYGLIVSASSLNFADTALNGSSASQTLTLTNQASSTITLGAPTLLGANPGDFTLTNGCSTSLASGSTCTVGVFATPSVSGLRTAFLQLASSSPGTPRYVALTVNTPATFTNSMVDGGGPSIIVLPGGNYLGVATDNNGGLQLYESAHLEDLFIATAPTTQRQLVPLPGTGHNGPGLVLWNNVLYLSYKDTDDNSHHVAVNSTPSNPLCSGCWVDHFVAAGGSSYDWSYMIRNGKLWEFYAADNSAPHNGTWVQLWTDPLHSARTGVQLSYSTPDTTDSMYRAFEFRHVYLGSNPVKTSSYGSNEAPVGFVYTDTNGATHTFVTYSSNSYRYGDYTMGLLTFNGASTDDLDNASLWTKAANPFLQPASYDPNAALGTVYPVCAVGSNTIVPSPDGTEFWSVYSGKFNCTVAPNPDYPSPFPKYAPEPANALTSPNGRTIRTQKLNFSLNTTDPQNIVVTPSMDDPWSDGTVHTIPSGESHAYAYSFLQPGTYDDSVGRLDSTGATVSDDTLTELVFYSDSWNTTTGNANDSTMGNGGASTQTLTDSHTLGSYFVVSYVGSRLQLYGPSGTCHDNNPCKDHYTDSSGNGQSVKDATYGTITVYLDGNLANGTTISLASALPNGVIVDTNSLPTPPAAGPHTIMVEVSGPANPVSGHGYPVALDYMVVTK